MTADELVELLKLRYAPPAYAFLEQVGNATGFSAQRHADGIAMSLWPSRGLSLEGFEVKVSSTDWRRELANPGKAEPIAAYMDRWWIVAPKGIVEPLGLPMGWGLIEAHAGKLRATKEAPALDPKPLDRGFLAAILRQAAASSPTYQMKEAARREAEANAESHLEQRVAGRTYDLTSRLESLERRIAEFEAEIGVPLELAANQYRFTGGAALARAFRYVATHDPAHIVNDANQLERLAKRILEISGELTTIGSPE